MITVPSEGEGKLLQAIIAAYSGRVALYENDYSPVDASVKSSFDIPADVNEGDLENGTLLGSPVDGRRKAIWDFIVFTNVSTTDDLDVYGYFVYDKWDDKIGWAERFDGAPLTIPKNGGTLVFYPALTLRSETKCGA